MTDTKYGTPYVETELILASTVNDRGEMIRLLGTLNDGELQELMFTISGLDAETRNERNKRLFTVVGQTEVQFEKGSKS